MYRRAELGEEAGDRQGAEALAREAADHDDTEALLRLASPISRARPVRA
ncbi:hypothetical protein OHU34_44815 (plasmid) [Streptomyces sp. NBC_00080]|nr:hypothetical protein [Streptomyces sp. SLBN-115]